MTESTLALSKLGITASDLAAFEVFLNDNCEIPEHINFADVEHLQRLAIALDKLRKWAPLLLHVAREAEDIDGLQAKLDDLHEELDIAKGDAEESQESAAEYIDALETALDECDPRQCAELKERHGRT